MKALTARQKHIAQLIVQMDVPKRDRPLTTQKWFRYTMCKLFCLELLKEDPALDVRAFFAACGCKVHPDDREHTFHRAALDKWLKERKSK